MLSQFTASVKKYDPDHEDDATFNTREEAEQWLLDKQAYGHFNMWLNNESVHIQNGRIVPHKLRSAAQVVSTAAQDIDTLTRAHTDFDRIFRPQSTRGSAPTNPNTLEAVRKL